MVRIKIHNNLENINEHVLKKQCKIFPSYYRTFCSNQQFPVAFFAKENGKNVKKYNAII
jgi:hypothetical protein